MSKTEQHSRQNDEISLKELFLKLGEWSRYIGRNWKLLLLAGISGGAIGIACSFLIQPTYTGHLTFVLEEEDGGNPLGAYMGLASQFGINLAGGESGMFSGANIMQLLQSRLMIERALLAPFDTVNSTETLADRYILNNELRKDWKDDPELANITFPARLERTQFTLQQDKVLKGIYKQIRDSHLQIDKPERGSDVIQVSCTFTDEKFARLFTERLVGEVAEFYIQTKTKRLRENIEKLQVKADSIEALLNEKTYALAGRQDLNLNTVRRRAAVPVELAEREKAILQTIYTEVVKNLEMSKLTLIRATPLIQVIDHPILPLEKNTLGNLKGLILGGFLGGFLMLLVLLTRRIYLEIMGRPV